MWFFFSRERFSGGEDGVWGVSCRGGISRSREESFWKAWRGIFLRALLDKQARQEEKDIFEERRNTTVSLLVSAGEKPFRCVFWTIYLLQ